MKIPRGPRHCHRGRLGREPLDASDRTTGRALGKEPVGGRSGSQETCRTNALRRGSERGRAGDSLGRGTLARLPEFVSSNGRFE